MDIKRIYGVILILGLGGIVVGILSHWNWNELEALATWFGLLGVIAAIWLINVTRENTTKQLEAARKSTNAQLAVELFRELRNTEAIEKLRSIYDLPYDIFTSEDVKILRDDKKKNIDYILDRFEMLGILVAEGIIDKKLAIEAYAGASSLRCWYQLHQYIKELRNQRGDFGEYFEALARLSLDYFYKEGKKVKFYREDEKDKVIDLIAELQKEGLRPRSLEEIEKVRKENKGQFEGAPPLQTNLSPSHLKERGRSVT